MVVVAIIAVLAAVVVPSFIKEGNRAKYKASEVQPMFAELATREDAYKVEAGSYLAAPAFPTAANASGTDVTTMSTAWISMRVLPSSGKLMCSYIVGVGASGVAPNANAAWPAWLTDVTVAITPGVGWYFIKATCPSNEYFTASWDNKIRSEDGN
jgi:type II secretory pathway pseudopilin PulG